MNTIGLGRYRINLDTVLYYEYETDGISRFIIKLVYGKDSNLVIWYKNNNDLSKDLSKLDSAFGLIGD